MISAVMDEVNNQVPVIVGGGEIELSKSTKIIEGMKRGIHAFMPTGMHYIYTKIYRDYMSGKHMEAKKLFYELLPVLAFSNQHLDISIHFFKRLLYKINLLYALLNAKLT